MARPKRDDGKNSHTEAKRAYNEKSYDRIALVTKKGNRDILKAYTDAQKISVNAFINRLLSEAVPGFKPFE